MAEIKEAAAIAAQWWTERISNHNPNNFNNGDRTSDSSFLMMIFGSMIAAEHAASPQQLEEFKNILAQKISDKLDSKDELFIDTDYGPCDILGEAATEVGIPTSIFPFKRMMWVSKTHVSARDGLDAPIVTLH